MNTTDPNPVDPAPGSSAALQVCIDELSSELARCHKEAQEFRGFVNRELRTGLSSILGFAQLLELNGNQTDREGVDEIIKSGQQLLRFIETELGSPTVERAAAAGGDRQSSNGDAISARADVLYIEDSEPNFMLVRHILRARDGIELLRASRGAVGLILARERRPRLILLDLNLPDMHGSELLRQLHAEKETASIPVVVISADATPSQIERLLAAGARNYLTKPFSIDEFLAVVDEVLEVDSAIA